MVEPHPPEHPEPPAENPSTRFERTDVNLRWFVIVGICSLILAAFVQGIILWFQHEYEGYEGHVKKSDFPLAEQRAALPSGPRLEQVNRRQEDVLRNQDIREGRPRKETIVQKIEAFSVYERRYAKGSILDSYGVYQKPQERAELLNIPVSERGETFVRIPITRAMDLLVQGQAPADFRLQVRPQTKALKAAGKHENGLRFGGGPNSGRVYQERE